ncbi:hypothetical protein LTR10_009973 [Elasticomyces elasticus]|nr:hypothetical protein LTR10_009973 [Elasticomyces elasticus]KAK4970265.1 hypothetical protein LTR42_008432 [Elasticomyces elasticus]KAK5720180.1 hypothetical protein LTR15_007453 [Elasticomyces elasticus]
MPFGQVFEKRVNADMQGENSYAQESKKARPSTPQPEMEAEDLDLSEKKERPPRFSTLFANPPPPPMRQPESFPEPKNKSGIWMPTSLFVLFAVILLFESTLLFAYTVIGFYNNMPTGFMPSAPAACNCEANKPAINIAPNFIMPQAQAPQQTITVLGNGWPSNIVSEPAISISTSTIISSSTAQEASSHASAIASNLLGILTSTPTASTTSSTTSTTPLPDIATSTLIPSVTPPRSTVDSIVLVTVNAVGSTLPPRSTVTSTKTIDASQAAAESSTKAALAGLAAAMTLGANLSSTTLATGLSTNPTTTEATTAAPVATDVSPP